MTDDEAAPDAVPDMATQFTAAAMADYGLAKIAGNLVGHHMQRPRDPLQAFDAVMEEASLLAIAPQDFAPEGATIDTDAAHRLYLESLGEALQLLRDIARATR